MLDQFPLTTLVTLITLLVYFYITLRVGAARSKFDVKAPSVDGPDEFNRTFRAQQNTLEQIVLYLPALWLFAFAWGDVLGSIIGVFWPIGRMLYAIGYSSAPEKRALGFVLGVLTTIALWLGALIGLISAFA